MIESNWIVLVKYARACVPSMAHSHIFINHIQDNKLSTLLIIITMSVFCM